MQPLQRHITQVDTETGECYAALAVVYPKRRNAFKNWAAYDMQELTRIAAIGLGQNDLATFLALLGRLDFENLIHINQAEVARSINLRPTNLGRSIRNLIDLGIIEQGPKVSGHRTYRLSPEIAWRGSAKNHHQAIRQRMKAAGIRQVITNHTDTPSNTKTK